MFNESVVASGGDSHAAASFEPSPGDSEHELLIGAAAGESDLRYTKPGSEPPKRHYKSSKTLMARLLGFELPQGLQIPPSSSTHHQSAKEATKNLTLFKQNWLKREQANKVATYKQAKASESFHSHHKDNCPPNYHDANLDRSDFDPTDGFDDQPPPPAFNQRREFRNKRATSCFKLTLTFLLLTVGFLLILGRLVALLEQRQRAIPSGLKGRKNCSTSASPALGSDYDANFLAKPDKQWLVSTGKCRVPAIDPWHTSISSYIKVNEQVNCSRYLTEELGEAMSYVEDNRLYFTPEALAAGFLLEGNCCFREIKRSGENDDDLIYDKNCQAVSQNGLQIPFEIINLECFGFQNGTQTNNSEKKSKSTKRRRAYGNVHAFIVPKPEEEQTLVRAMAKNLNPEEYYNIVMIGMDTMSRLNAHRQLPKTMKTLREKFGAIEYFGYNKVGENTFPNLVPLLTGLKPEQLVETKCWLSTNYTDENESGDEYLNDCKYLWNFFQEFGYMTFYSEDWPQASTFNYLKPGFKQEPTAYYGRPITLARQKFITGRQSYMDCDICVLDKPIASLDLEQLKTYLKVYQKNPNFAFQWMNCPQHNDMNGGSKVDEIVNKFLDDIHPLTQLDRSFVFFFSDHGWRWNDFIGTPVGHYEASLPLMTISPPKRFIERHPELYERLKSHTRTLFTPFDLFKTLLDIRNLAKRSEPANLFNFYTDFSRFMQPTNARLAFGRELDSTSTANVATLATTEPDETEPETSQSSTAVFKQIPALDGTSFEQKFPTFSLVAPANSTLTGNRSCQEAGIPDNYCVCHEFKETSVDKPDVLAAAYYLVYVHLDSRVLEGEKICARLKLKRINKAERFDFEPSRRRHAAERKRRSASEFSLAPRPKKLKPITTTAAPSELRKTSLPEQLVDESHFLPKREYNLRVVTEPGEGIFQEVIRFYGRNMADCESAALETKKIVNRSNASPDSKRLAVMEMNKKCKFSIHSDSISRLNLYKDQSRCVKNNSELHKVCYCKDLLPAKRGRKNRNVPK